MVLAMNGRPSEANLFLFRLAEKLGKSLAEVRAFPALELVQWAAYFAAQGQRDELQRMVSGR